MKIDYATRPLPLSAHQYAVVDRRRVPELPDGWPLIELVSPMLAPQAHLYPWLLPLHELAADEWRMFTEQLAQYPDRDLPPRCSLLLSSPQPPQVVRSALVSALYFQDEHRQGHILRYYDPRVLFHLHWMLTPWQLFSLLSAQDIPHWTFWLDGGWHTLAFPERIAYRPGDTEEMSLQQLQRCGLINQVLATLPHSADLPQRRQISRRIAALLEQALGCGLSAEEDRIAFARHGLKLRDEFWAMPKMAAFLAQASQNPDLYRDETNNWDDKRWLDMTQPSNNGWND